MKLLVIARRLHVDRSSEGICSSKFVLALARAGIDFVCLTRDEVADVDRAEPPIVPWLPGVRVTHTRRFAGGKPLAHRLHARTPAALARKTDTAVFFLSGHRLDTHRNIDVWQRAVQSLIAIERPSAIVVRGEGVSFDAHIAMARLNPTVPWIAHYHDPYPSSLYPEPYRAVLPMASRRQERDHAAILQHCDALSFPSRRMLEWVLQGPFAHHRQKAFVLPHLASRLPGCDGALPAHPIEAGTFALVHTGALLGPRSPIPLLEAFERWVADDPGRRARARLVLAGPVHAAHSSDSRWAGLVRHPNVACLDRRLRYDESLALARQASVNVVIEADAETSPFLPAKFADYVHVDHPVLALSPRQSAVADALGPSSPLVVSPDDRAAIAGAIDLMWGAWRNGRLAEYAPPAALRAEYGEASIVDRLFGALRFVEDRRSRPPAARGILMRPQQVSK